VSEEILFVGNSPNNKLLANLNTGGVLVYNIGPGALIDAIISEPLVIFKTAF
jgi:hypothetical protein